METNQKKPLGPHLGILALLFTVFFNTGLSFVVSMSGKQAHFPGPWEPAQTITTYFQIHPHDVLMCSFFQFIAAVPLALFAVTVMNRLWVLGNKSVGPYIALMGGLITAINVALSASILWVMAYPGIAQDASVIRTLYYMAFAVGGVGYSVPLGLLIAGISVSVGLMKLLPRWLVIIGLVIAFIGEASCLSLVVPNLLALIPLTRFPGFIWLVCVGFMLPKTVINKEPK
ncbi:hypothetical protein [Mucilaginibacter sp. OK098]|uniref:hypothetical protein n=1 Tax=Mucilaginibacter sp. OK098 TaxID=1855297 RepID=UPI0009225258|nr:hypothetical protein [Mucilaginibacter sp. OK098]SHM74616.1 hypothetical protein SAMN05216524_103260 [Mucilaginibacter sp. OK098]